MMHLPPMTNAHADTNTGTTYYCTASSPAVIRELRSATKGRAAVQARGLRVVVRTARPMPFIGGVTVHNADRDTWVRAVPAWLGVAAR
jgi:hypothetical protein